MPPEGIGQLVLCRTEDGQTRVCRFADDSVWLVRLVKGFAIDGERLKQPGGGDYFDELLARIRDIRSSKRLF